MGLCNPTLMSWLRRGGDYSKDSCMACLLARGFSPGLGRLCEHPRLSVRRGGAVRTSVEPTGLMERPRIVS